MEPSSAQVLLRLAAGSDPQAWGLLVERFGPPMYRAAAAVLGREGADDAVQEAFLQVAARAGCFRPRGGDPETEVRRWLCRVAVNCAIDWRRREGRRTRRERRIAPMAEPMTPVDPDLRLVLNEELRGQLRAALSDMGESARRPIVLRYFAGCDDAALARELGCSAGAARMRLSRSLEQLRRRMGPLLALIVLERLLGAAVATAAEPPPELLPWCRTLPATGRRPNLPHHRVFAKEPIMTRLALTAAAALLAGGLTWALLPGGEPAPRPAEPPAAARLFSPGRAAQEPPIPAGDAAEAVRRRVSEHAAFAYALYGRLAAGPGNIFVSPYSVSSALAMALTGADGQTRAEMRATLGVNLPDEQALAADAALLAALRPREVQDDGGEKKISPFALQVANRLWGQRGYPWQASFLESCTRFFGAGLEQVDFQGDEPATRTRINRWVEEQTSQKIRNIIGSPLDPVTRLVIANAIYFKSSWDQNRDFSKEATREEAFRSPSGPVQVPLMHQTDHFLHAPGDGFHLAVLPYRGGQVEMVLILPDAADGLAAVERKLTPENLALWRGQATFQTLDLSLPRFKLERTYDRLSDTMQAMGMRQAFDPRRADFGRMKTAAEPLWIGTVVHKSYLAVDEEGTEAAAATAIMVEGKSIDRDAPIPFRCDRPFVFLIRHVETGALLFMGRLVQPGAP